MDALMMLCSSKGYFTVDGLRRTIKDMGKETFETMPYYERWVATVSRNMIKADAYTLAELGKRMEQIKACGETYGEAVDG